MIVNEDKKRNNARLIWVELPLPDNLLVILLHREAVETRQWVGHKIVQFSSILLFFFLSLSTYRVFAFFQIFSVFFPVVIPRLEVRKEGRKAKAEKGRDEAGHSWSILERFRWKVGKRIIACAGVVVRTPRGWATSNGRRGRYLSLCPGAHANT